MQYMSEIKENIIGGGREQNCLYKHYFSILSSIMVFVILLINNS